MSFTISKIWNSSVWIIGGGRSLKEQCGLSLDASENLTVNKMNEYFGSKLRDKRVIGLNHAIDLLSDDWIDIGYFGDARFLDWFYNGIKKSNKTIYTCAGLSNTQLHKIKQLNIKQINRSRYNGIDLSRPRDEIGWFGNTGASAIHLALLLGATKIYLLGYDGQYNEKDIRNNNWHSPYPQGYSNDLQGAERVYRSFRQSFDTVRKGTDKAGIEVINCTLNTKIEAFKLGDFESELNKC